MRGQQGIVRGAGERKRAHSKYRLSHQWKEARFLVIKTGPSSSLNAVSREEQTTLCELGSDTAKA